MEKKEEQEEEKEVEEEAALEVSSRLSGNAHQAARVTCLMMIN